MAEIVADDLMVCVVCTHLIANGEYVDGTDAAEIAGKALETRWADAQLVMACGEDCDGEFGTRPCDGCGDELHGDRHPAVALR